jgi:hypothetical protein
MTKTESWWNFLLAQPVREYYGIWTLVKAYEINCDDVEVSGIAKPKDEEWGCVTTFWFDMVKYMFSLVNWYLA